MGAVEDRLAELGLSVPEVAKPVASYVPAVRSGTYVYTSGQLPMRSGELMTTGKVGAAVSPEEAAACAQQCALNAIAAVKAEIGDLDAVKRVVKVVCFVASDAGVHRPAAGRQRRLRPARQGVRRGRACTRAPRSAYPCCRWTPRSRSRSSSRCQTCGWSAAATAGGARAGVRRGTPYAGRAAGRRDGDPDAPGLRRRNNTELNERLAGEEKKKKRKPGYRDNIKHEHSQQDPSSCLRNSKEKSEVKRLPPPLDVGNHPPKDCEEQGKDV